MMENLRLVLAGLDLGFEHVVMARIYLTRFKRDYAAMNDTIGAILPLTACPPAPVSASPALPMTR